MWTIPLFKGLPEIEFAKHLGRWGTDFFPCEPKSGFGSLDRICIGSKTRTLGDALALSILPRKLKEKFPALQVTTYPRAFNPVVFYGNPYVSGVDHLPKRLYGDDINQGSGQLIQLKEQGFHFDISDAPAPEIYLMPHEKKWGETKFQEWAGKDKRPVIFLHPWGHTWKDLLSESNWSKLLSPWKEKFRFWQLGLHGETPIEGVDRMVAFPKRRWEARKLFAILKNGFAFIGVNSGPMHIVRAWKLPALILIREGDPKQIFAKREKGPYFLFNNWAHSFLYEDWPHLNVPDMQMKGTMDGMANFLSALKVPSEELPGSVSRD